MTTETKRRLLLSKWRGVAIRSEVDRRMERLLIDVDRLNDLIGKISDQDDKIETLEADLKEAREQIESLESEQDARCTELESVLVDVKYWMHAAQFRRSWPLLRKVEDVLGT
jgi:seryl-tRNA synthetase